MADSAELRRLRERAYGPHADIETDAAAAARLDRLQNPASVVSSETVQRHEPTSEAPGRRRRAIPLVVAVLAAGLISAAVTAVAIGAGRPEATDRSGTVVATLHPDPSLPFPSQISSARATLAQGVRYDDYLGVVVVSIPARQGDGSRCLYVLPQLTAGALVGGCAAGPFLAQVTLVVTDDMPDELLAEHEAGTPLRFDLEGSDVVVEVGDRYGSGVPPRTAR